MKSLNILKNEDYLLIQNEINELPYIVKKAKETGMKIILNPSPMNDKIKELPLNQINYFLLNEIEAMQILDMEEPKEIDGKYISGLLHQKFPEATIVLTLGSEGSVCISGDEYVEQSIYKVKDSRYNGSRRYIYRIFYCRYLKWKNDQRSKWIPHPKHQQLQ